MSSRIEQIIEEIEEFVESCKYQPLSTTKIVVNKEELEELLRELRLKTPDEVKKYQKIIGNRDAILEDAKEKSDSMLEEAQRKADMMIADAQEKAKELISQHEIMQQAYAQANETVNAANKQAHDTVVAANEQAQQIVDEATMDANNIRMGAISYTDSMLGNVEEILANAINEANERYSSYVSSMQSCYEIVSQNRSELAPQEEEHTSEENLDVKIDLDDLNME